MLNNNNPGWFKPASMRYLDTGEPFKGLVQKIVLSGTVKYYDVLGRELQPIGHKEPPSLTEAELFNMAIWTKQQ